MVYSEGELDLFLKHMAHSETAKFIHRHFSFKTPSPQLSIKTQQTKNNSKASNPDTYVLLGWEPGTCRRQHSQLLELFVPLTSDQTQGGSSKVKLSSRRDDRCSCPSLWLGPASAAANWTCHHNVTDFLFFPFLFVYGPVSGVISLFLWATVSLVVFLSFSSLFDYTYYVSGIVTKVHLPLSFPLTGLQCRRGD